MPIVSVIIPVHGDAEPLGRSSGGSFAFALDSHAWQARSVERGVRWRVRWLGLPFGDQGIFVGHSVFRSIKGFATWPLLEDVDLVVRLKRVGTLRHLRLRLTTSARRWSATAGGGAVPATC